MFARRLLVYPGGGHSLAAADNRHRLMEYNRSR